MMFTIERRVKPNAPYDMMRVLLKLGADPMYKLNLDEQCLSFPVRVREDEREDGKKAVCFLTNEGQVKQPQIFVRVVGETLTEAEQDLLFQALEYRFQWKSAQLTQFYQAFAEIEPLHALLMEFEGLPFVLEEGVYEGLIKTIIHQQLNLRFAQQLVKSLATDYGDTLHIEGQDYSFLPTAEQLAQVPVEELRTKKFSQRKAEYITGVAQKVTRGELDLQAMTERTNKDFIQRLSEERGIGTWTAECILLFCLGRPDLFPAGDLGIRNAVKKLEGLEERPSIEACKAWVKPHQQWGSYLALYLWESLGNNRIKIEK